MQHCFIHALRNLYAIPSTLFHTLYRCFNILVEKLKPFSNPKLNFFQFYIRLSTIYQLIEQSNMTFFAGSYYTHAPIDISNPTRAIYKLRTLLGYDSLTVCIVQSCALSAELFTFNLFTHSLFII